MASTPARSNWAIGMALSILVAVLLLAYLVS